MDRDDGSAPFGALRDIRVLDLTQFLAGPFCTMVLADHGADVVKIEPLEGDMARANGPYRPGDEVRSLGAFFQSVDRNKRSVCLDLKHEEGRAAFKAMVRDADVVVENFRAGVMDRLGLSYETLAGINPRLVYATLRGFGDRRTGASPYVDWPAFDVVAQAMGGIMAITGPAPGQPTKVGPGVGDIFPGVMLAFGVVAAVHHARNTGEGQFVDISMLDSILLLCERTVWQHSVLGLTPGPEGNHHPFAAPFGLFPASDGHVAIAAPDEGFFNKLVSLLEMEALMEDPRFSTRAGRAANRVALIEAVAPYTARHSKAELMRRLGGVLPFGPVMDIAEIRADPHYAAREMIVDIEQPGGEPIQVAGVPLKMTRTPGKVARRSPLLGEHTTEELKKAGLTDEEIDLLVEHRAARRHTP